MNWLNTIDVFFFRLINNNGFSEIDQIMLLISGKLTWIPLYILIIYIIFKKFSNKFIWIIISLSLLIFLSDFGSVHLFKDVFERLRPCHQLERVRIVNECGGLYSFISSHASNSFAIAFFVSIILKNIRIFIFLFSWATIIGYSRVYLGVHFPFDIIGGMFWGLFVSLLTYMLLKSRINESI